MILQKFTLFSFLFLFSFSYINAQSPAITWQKNYGGSQSEGIEEVKQTPDGGFIFAGASKSGIDGNKTVPSRGDWDYWVVGTDADGESIWQSVAGGTGVDQLGSMDITDDGGVVLGGHSNSMSSGDKSEDSKGMYDYWVVKLDHTGAISWDVTIGGDGLEQLNSIEQTTDGGYILGGISFSGISGDKTQEAFGDRDIWIVKIDSVGNIEWQQTFGGDMEDEIFEIHQTSDDGYIIGSYSLSDTTGNKTEPIKGGIDYWVIKLTATGAVEWQKVYGGSDWDFLTSIEQTLDGGYIMVGQSDSPMSIDKSENNHGGSDCWVIKTDPQGNIEWDNTIGGTDDEIPICIRPTSNGGYILGGATFSGTSGDITDPIIGGGDAWVVMMDANGNIVWDKIVGTGWIDQINSIVETSDKGFMLGGFSGFFTGGNNGIDNFGEYDFFAVKLEGCPPTTGSTSVEVCNEYTDPNGEVYVDAGNYSFTYSIPNAEGCDSLITVDLTINSPSDVSMTETACDEYILPSGEMITQSGVYTEMISGGNSSGCDSYQELQDKFLNQL